MKKIPSLFARNHRTNHLVRNEVVKGSEWVKKGEGVATRKYDGTACRVKDGKLYKRYDCKEGRTAPPGFEPCEPERDEHTGHWPGWILVGDGPEDRWHREAFVLCLGASDGTYELCGPKINGNPERFAKNSLTLHGSGSPLTDCPRTFAGLKRWFVGRNIEGIVWHHPDGRMVKIKKRDFGLARSE